MTQTVGIIDYGNGNIMSVKNALEMIGADVKVCSYPEELLAMDRLVLPGVGVFKDCIGNLRSRGFVEALERAVVKKSKPILGICLGMQVMAGKGYEGGEFAGLGWFEAEVVRLVPAEKTFRIPHVGWNNIRYKNDIFLFAGLPVLPDVYFAHSFYMRCRRPEEIIAEFEYSGWFTAAVKKGNIVATQFHPEKSQDYGMVMLTNFINWKP